MAEPTNSPPSDTAVSLTGANAVETRAKAVEMRAALARTRSELERQQAEAKADLERQQKELMAQFDAKRAELEAQMAPLKEQIAQMVEVLWTVDLYLGRDETLRLLRDGAPAPADTPISVRQRVLVMAEESLVLMGRRETGMDASDVPEFVNWLLEDDTHLDQVLPESKGVVVLIPTKVESRSGNIFEDSAKDSANKRAYWVIRNGEKVYLLTTDPDLKLGERVLPKRTEFTEVFERRLFGYGGPSIGEPVEPGSDEWMAMEKRASSLQRHYMRILLVLQGLIDRTPAWRPLPEGGVSFMRLADQDAGRIRLIQDGDESILLTDGRPDFATWQRTLNARLRPGMRLIGDWGTRDFRDLYREGDRFTRGYHPRIHPGNAEYPPAKEPLLIEDRRDGGFVVRYTRTEKVYKRNVPVPGEPGWVYREAAVEASQRASCVVMPGDDWVLAYDLASVDDLTYYLESRENRSQRFLTMVPVVRAALAAKHAEAEQERPFRDYLTSQLIAAGTDPEDAPGLIEDLVHWWKVKNTWARPLNGEPEHEAKAAREIIAEQHARKGHETDDFADTATRVGQQVPGALAVTRNRRGQWHVYSATSPVHDEGVYVDITTIRRDGTLGTTKTGQVPTQRAITALHVAWAADAWATWQFGQNPRHYLTEDERTDLIQQMRDLAPGLPLCVTEYHDAGTDPARRTLAVYSWVGDQPPEDQLLRAQGAPYSWHYRGEGELITATVRSVIKDTDGVHLEAPGRHEHPMSFSTYSATSRWGVSIPWWPDDATRYSEVRPRLSWADEDALDRISDYALRCKKAAMDEQVERQRQSAEVDRHVKAITGAIRARQLTEARARFDEDFGADSGDLWPAHLKTLTLPSVVSTDGLRRVVHAALDNGRPITGQTLDQLADAAVADATPDRWGFRHQRMDTHGFGDITAPGVDAGGGAA